MPNANTAVRMMIGGVPVQPFSMATLPPLGNPNPQLADALKQLSAAKYGRPKAQVEADIFKRLTTQTPAMPTLPAGFGNQPPPRSGSWDMPKSTNPSISPTLKPKAPGTGASFLDEWLAKRKDTAQPITRPSMSSQTAPASARVPDSKLTTEPAPATITPIMKNTDLPSNEHNSTPGQGEFKINRDNNAQATQDHTVHIDKDGNLSFEQ